MLLDEVCPIWNMQITRASDYAIRVMVHLASRPEGAKVPLAALVHATGVSESFLSKILQRLVHTGLVSSHRGTSGGFKLRVRPDETKLLDVIAAIEGPIELNLCLGSREKCERQGWCGVRPVWQVAQEALSGVLRGVTIAELARATEQNLRAVEGVVKNQGEAAAAKEVQ